jgi:neutral ceramidase
MAARRLTLVVGCAALLTACGGAQPLSAPEDAVSNSRALLEAGEPLYLVGAGLYDITGPAAEVGMMGFAETAQKTEGIFMRLWSRAFAIGDGSKRVVFVSADLGMVFQSVKQGVARKLAADPELSPWYDERNVLISATHTHSGPGGYSHYFLYNATTSGFIPDNYEVIVDGIYRSILLAHRNLAPGRVYVNEGDLADASMNRSPIAYENNPAAERARYPANVDTRMTLLRLEARDGTPIGAINWFAVHPTNMGPTNRLIGGDHKGLASYLFERDHGTDYAADRTFVAAFAQSNAGDVTPNLWGPADGVHDRERLGIIAGRQESFARSLFDAATARLQGSVDYRHAYVDMPSASLAGSGATLCPAAMGASFAAGSTEDNSLSVQLFPEGVTVDSLSWTEDARSTLLANLLPGVVGLAWPATLDAAYEACHGAKPILIPTGLASFDGHPWTPPVVPVQILKIGQLKIVGVPAEVTTMAGRRLREAVRRSPDEAVVIAGLSNAYTSYISTAEEYAKQHYEGASTQFGPNTLAAYQQEFSRLADALASGAAVPPGPTPADLSNEQLTLQTGVVFDDAPWFKQFGDVVTQPAASYARGAVASAVFWGGHPRNNPLIRSSFLDVERLVGGAWVTVARDLDPATTYRWQRDGIAYSKITVAFDTLNAAPGTYRLRHRGYWKSGWTGKLTAYEGVTRTFAVQ